MSASQTQRANDNENELISALGRERFRIFRDHRFDRESSVSIVDLSLQQAYKVQAHYIALRIGLGEKRVGWKVGCTSPAIQQQFGLTQPIHGCLLSPYIYPDRVTLDIEDYIDCAIEPEFVFHIGSDISPESDYETLRRSVVAISPGIEIHNYRFWYGSPTSQELIASNGIHAGLVVGTPQPLLPATELNSEVATAVVNDKLVASGLCSEVMGGPWNSLEWLSRQLSEGGEIVRAGDLVIPGSAVNLVPIRAGDAVEARFSSLGSCHAAF
jgi:2-keto-4-pentenoate hydratase